MKAREFRVFDKGTLHRVCGLLSQLLVSEEHPLLISVTPYSEQRTLAQNKLLHALLRDVADQVEVRGRRFSAAAWKEEFRQRFIGTEEIDLPSGERIERGISTTTLNVGQMAEAITMFQAWLASEFGYLAEEAA
ncbi:MAG: recombination protein NinB [Candidatus Binatia bacterium]|nr:recombination protein NinB [Candidatus Binatia bacterium]